MSKIFFFSGFKDRSTHPYKCDLCGRTYKQKKNLTRHLTVDCGVEPAFPCPRCDCRCKRKSSLKRHLIEMHKVKPCQLAAFGLGISYFATHLMVFFILICKIRTGSVIRPENQFKCDRCGTSYKHKHHLKRHLVKKCGK